MGKGFCPVSSSGQPGGGYPRGTAALGASGTRPTAESTAGAGATQMVRNHGRFFARATRNGSIILKQDKNRNICDSGMDQLPTVLEPKAKTKPSPKVAGLSQLQRAANSPKVLSLVEWRRQNRGHRSDGVYPGAPQWSILMSMDPSPCVSPTAPPRGHSPWGPQEGREGEGAVVGNALRRDWRRGSGPKLVEGRENCFSGWGEGGREQFLNPHTPFLNLLKPQTAIGATEHTFRRERIIGTQPPSPHQHTPGDSFERGAEEGGEAGGV